MPSYPRMAQFKTVEQFRQRLAELELQIPLEEKALSAADGSPLARECEIDGFTVGNRWCIHPMEGWDANPDGSPSEHTLRRWRNFGLSGAKLIWGGEAAAVQPGGRANPNQTLATEGNREGLRRLLESLESAHREAFGSLEGLLVGLQLTHSGRFCRPSSKANLEPKIAYHHPLLDAKFQIDPNDDSVVWTDAEIEQLINDFVAASKRAEDVGFRFVDIKACHGYLLHEFLSARRREGKYGGDLEGRTRLLRTIIQRVREACPRLMVGVRLSVYDLIPFEQGEECGRPMEHESYLPYEFGFGVSASDPTEIDLTEPLQLIGQLKDLGVSMVNLSCGSPYYNPHMQRPATFPPSDGYQPPEDPLVGVARMIHASKVCKNAFPSMRMVGTGYTYLQEYLPHVAQGVVREGWIDFVGLGRMVLSYPTLPADTLAGKSMARKQICRTFSDCTTAPRNGIVSGCFPLDAYYKGMDEALKLKQLKGKA